MDLFIFYDYVRCGLWASSGPLPLSAHYELYKRGRDPPTIPSRHLKKERINIPLKWLLKEDQGRRPTAASAAAPSRATAVLAAETATSPCLVRYPSACNLPAAAAAAAGSLCCYSPPPRTHPPPHPLTNVLPNTSTQTIQPCIPPLCFPHPACPSGFNPTHVPSPPTNPDQPISYLPPPRTFRPSTRPNDETRPRGRRLQAVLRQK